MNVMHSSRRDDWMTPLSIINMVKAVMGVIDLDPCSSTRANSAVGAVAFYDSDADGLAQAWGSVAAPKSVYCNPPGGKAGNKSLAALFWVRLMHELAHGHIKQAVFMAFSAEALQTTQDKDVPSIMHFPICVPKSRIRFVFAGPATKVSPSHSNVIVYVPGTVDRTDVFMYTFRALGACKA